MQAEKGRERAAARTRDPSCRRAAACWRRRHRRTPRMRCHRRATSAGTSREEIHSASWVPHLSRLTSSWQECCGSCSTICRAWQLSYRRLLGASARPDRSSSHGPHWRYQFRFAVQYLASRAAPRTENGLLEIACRASRCQPVRQYARPMPMLLSGQKRHLPPPVRSAACTAVCVNSEH